MSDESTLFSMTEWGPPLLVMGAALAGGAFLASRLRREESEAGHVELEGHRMDLENRRDEALQQLASLESQQQAMNPEDYSAERKALLTQGSQAMRELDGLNNPLATSGGGGGGGGGSSQDEAIASLTAALKAGDLDPVTYAKAVAALGESQPASAPSAPSPAPASPPPPAAATVGEAKPSTAPAKMSPAWQGAMYALIGAGLIGGLLYFISDASQPRVEGASMTGNQDLGTGERPPAGVPGGKPPWVKKSIADAEAKVKANPEDLAALNTLTQLNLDQPQVAWGHNEAARKVAPDDPDALMFEAVITSIMSMPDKAQAKFDALLEKYPDHAGAWAYKGLTLLEAKKYPEAAAALQKAKDLGLNDPSIENALGVAKNNGIRPMAGPGSANGAQAAPSAPSATVASGTINLDPNRSTFKAVTLFVSVHDPSMPGPPLASVKLPPGPYPMDFTVTEANKIPMMGDRPIPANFTLKVRLDDDGNAMTKAATDPQAKLEGLSAGAKGLNITLK